MHFDRCFTAFLPKDGEVSSFNRLDNQRAVRSGDELSRWKAIREIFHHPTLPARMKMKLNLVNEDNCRFAQSVWALGVSFIEAQCKIRYPCNRSLIAKAERGLRHASVGSIVPDSIRCSWIPRQLRTKDFNVFPALYIGKNSRENAFDSLQVILILSHAAFL